MNRNGYVDCDDDDVSSSSINDAYYISMAFRRKVFVFFCANFGYVVAACDHRRKKKRNDVECFAQNKQN